MKNLFELNNSRDYYLYLDSKLKEYYFTRLGQKLDDNNTLILDSDNEEALLKKLEQDGYIENYTNPKITMKEVIFFLDGGYTEKRRKSAIATNNKLIQNWTIAIGAGIAGIYVIAQVIHSIFIYLCKC